MRKIFICCALCMALLSYSSYGQVKLPQLIANNMVLQRDTKLQLWGWASPHENVKITFLNKKYKAKADATGKWMVALPPQKAGGPYTLDIQATNHIQLNNILIGDVWFCSGQSNMVINMERVKERYPDDIAAADIPQIRNFFIPTVSDVGRVHDDLPSSQWQVATPANVLNFGAVSYFFARQLYKKYHVPVGIINASVGGTPIQAWISKSGLKEIPSYSDRAKQFEDTTYLNRLIHPVITKRIATTHQQLDQGTSGPKMWYDTTFVPKGWHPFWLPGYWEDQGVRGLNGIVWFRKEINIPAALAGKPAKLFMGRIVDADETYVNGILCGTTTYQYPPRRYIVPAGILKPGKNVIVVKIINNSGKGGFVPQKLYHLDVDGIQIDLRGDWLYQVGQVFKNSYANYTSTFSAQNEPTGLYNTMVAPIIDYKVKGFVWYQGETNTDKPQEYTTLLKALVADWRNKWGNANLPFVFAQLPNYMEVQYSPSESKWAELREAQLQTLAVPNTAMAVAIDAGEWNDIHPLNKKSVGERLTLGAEKIAYGDMKDVTSGPILQSSKIEDNKIVLTFTETGSGLIAKDSDELKQFAIAGADKKFVWAKATISGNTVTVYNEDVSKPMYVRYAWANNPEGANLYNREGLPASPFRTDQ